MTKRKRCRVCKKSWAAKNRTECKACRRLAEQEQRAAEPRRTCRACGQEKRVSGFYQWRDSRSGAPRIDLDCRACKRKRTRERYAEMMADPYLASRENKRKAEWHRAHPNTGVEACRRYRERLKRERPEVHQQQLEDARIRARLRNERLGIPTGPTHVVVHEKKSHASLSVEPLVEFLALVPEGTIDALHPSSQRAIRRLSEDPGVSPLVADRIVTACGGALPLVYPELYA